MHITKVTFKNFMGYKALQIPKEGDFPQGLILISGKNSHGKSSILQGILLTFFGSGLFSSRNAASFITYGESKAEIFIYFTLDNIKYYIFRKWGRTGSATVKLFEEDKKSKKFLEIKNFKIEDFFEISKEQALSTVFVRQGEVEELANLKGAKLRDMIIDLFRLDIIDDSLKHLDIQRDSRNLEKSELEASRVPIERINQDIERLRQQNLENEDLVKNKKKMKVNHEKKLKTYPSINLINKLEGLYQQEKLTQNKYLSYKKDFEAKIQKTEFNSKDLTSLDKISSRVSELIHDIEHIVTKKKEFERKRQATTKGIGNTKGRIEDTQNKIKKMTESLSFTQKQDSKEIAQCPTCQSELTKEHYDNVIKEFKKDLKTNQDKIQKITTLIEKQSAEITIMQNDLDEKNKEKILIQNLKEDYENYSKHETELVIVQKALKDFLKDNDKKFDDLSLDGIKKVLIEIERLTTELISIQNDIVEKENLVKSNETRISELNAEINKMKEVIKKIGEIEIDIEHLNKAKEFVRRFVTEYMVIKRLVKNITLKTDNYIKDFTSGQYNDLLLDLTGTKKTGLSLKIKDNFNGQYEPIEVLSGGDRTALGMALRLAISELMSIIRPTKESPKRNPKINFLLLDEPLAALDEDRRERILKYLINLKTFTQIFLITHTVIPQDIQTHKILVEKDHSNGFSNARFERIDRLLIN